MLTLAELLALLARWSELDDTERASLNEGLSAEAIAVLAANDPADVVTLREALLSASDQMLDAGDDLALEALEWIADEIAVIDGVETEIATADQDRADRAQALRDRIHGTDPEDPDPQASDAGDGTEGEGEGEGTEAGAGDGDGEGAEAPEGAENQPEPVAAAGATVPARNTPGAARRPAARRPSATMGTAPLTAAAGLPGIAMGTPLDPERMGRAIEQTLASLPPGGLRAGQMIKFATAKIEFPDDSFLDMNPRLNARKLDGVVSRSAMAASGGICAPKPPRYDLPTISVADRPVRGVLTRFGADRGGVSLPGVPSLVDVEDAVGVWTIDDDRAAVDDDELVKACMRIDCGDDPEVTEIDAVTRCFEVGNFNARTWPERVDRFMQLADSQHARVAERKMLTEIAALSKHVTAPQVIGAGRDILTNIDLLTSGTSSRLRMADAQRWSLILPFWLENMIRADLARELPGSTQERLATSDAEIASFFAVRNIDIAWALDGETGQEFPVQNNGAIVGWPAQTIGYMFPVGEMLFLDGGELDFGLTRDNTSNAKNNFRMQKETFEKVARYGAGESFRIAMTLCPDGSTSGTVELTCPDSASS